MEVKQLPGDPAALDELLNDPALVAPIAEAWDAAARERGRPSIAIETYVRLMVVKNRAGWGYETLVREVSDSLHLAERDVKGTEQPAGNYRRGLP